MADSLIKAAADGGIFFARTIFTKEACKIAWHIVTTSPYKAVTSAVCSNCKKLYDDDGLRACKVCRFKVLCVNYRELYDDDEYHLIHGTYLCEACR